MCDCQTVLLMNPAQKTREAVPCTLADHTRKSMNLSNSFTKMTFFIKFTCYKKDSLYYVYLLQKGLTSLSLLATKYTMVHLALILVLKGNKFSRCSVPPYIIAEV